MKLDLPALPAPIPGDKPPRPHIGDIQHRSPHELKTHPKNPRTHLPKQIAKLKASITEFGFTTVLLVDEYNTILLGHGRQEAAIELGLETVPVRVVTGWTEPQKLAYVIADNKTGLLSEWDDKLLHDGLEILVMEDFDMELTAFDTAEIDDVLEAPSQEPKHDPDELQPQDVCDDIVTKVGDLWQLDQHRLLCADATQPQSYAILMQGELAELGLTDPPYNVKIDGHVGGKGKIKHKEFPMASGEMTKAEFIEFLRNFLTPMKESLRDGAVNFIFMDWRHMLDLRQVADPLFGEPRQCIVWNKGVGGMGTFYRSQYENCLAYRKGDTSHINNFGLGENGRYRTNVWDYAGAQSGKGRKLLKIHPTCKPVALISDAIRDCSDIKGIVLDPFCGSGTILVACERTKRRARAMELWPQYVDVAIQRWQRITGKQAILQLTGQTWEQVRAQRLLKIR